MWLFLSAVMVCLTIMILFRMYIDLRRNDNMHARSLHRDSQNFQRYTAVTSRPVQKPAMPDFRGAIEHQNAIRTWHQDEHPRPSLEELRQAEQMVRYKSARIDPRLLNEAQLRYLEAMEDRRRRTL
jgi:hypothetical protein